MESKRTLRILHFSSVHVRAFLGALGAAAGFFSWNSCHADAGLYEQATRSGLRAYEQGDYRLATRELEAALHAARAAFAETDPQYLAAVGELGRVYLAQGRYRDAEELHRHSVAVCARYLPWHPALAASLSKLAETFRLQGKNEEAEPLYRRALAIRERHYGSDHLLVAESLHNLAEIKRAQGEYPEAERLYWRSVMIRSYLQGASHAELWPTLKGLAEINRALGRPGEADKLYARASAIAEKSIPAASTRARLYDFAVGDTETAAIARGSSVSLLLMPGSHLAEREALKASEHPEVARQLEGLAEIYRAQGRYLEAIDLMRRVVLIRERVFSAGHPEVARSYEIMSALLALQRGAPAPGARSAEDRAPAPAAPR